MGTILSSRTLKEGKIVYEVELDYEESLQLRGHMKNVYLFSEDVTDANAYLSSRGKNEITKYFLIPKELRRNLKFNNKVTCQKLETPSKVVFIYVVDKLMI